MDRLTIRNSDGSVSQPTDLRWAEALEKLAAYEDTGLTPEEIKNLNNGIIPNHWSELFIAECEDRLIVLPCKLSDTVWNHELEAWKVVSIEWFSMKVTQLHCVSPVSGRRHTFSIGKRSLGKTVFLTREGAEKALEAEK